MRFSFLFLVQLIMRLEKSPENHYELESTQFHQIFSHAMLGGVLGFYSTVFVAESRGKMKTLIKFITET